MQPIGPQLLARLVEDAVPALVLYARQWCDSPEDVVQEALVQLVRQPASPPQVVPWLYRVVRNGAISAGRSARRRRHHETSVAKDAGAWFEAADGAAIDADSAAAALETLDGEQRETIVARLWGGLSFEEIGELTNTSSSTAHRRYQAGLTTLRERLGMPCPTKNSRTAN